MGIESSIIANFWICGLNELKARSADTESLEQYFPSHVG